MSIWDMLASTWPAQMGQTIAEALMAPGNAYKSTPDNPVTTEQMVKPAADLAGLVTSGSFAAPAMKDAAGMGIRAYHRVGVEESPFGEAIIRSVDHPDELIRVRAAGDAVYPGFNILSEEHRGTGLGSALYRQAIDWAASKGLPFRSDGSVSSDAVRLYNSLKKQGYQVTEAPGTERQASGGMVNRGVGYVFEVKPPALGLPQNPNNQVIGF